MIRALVLIALCASLTGCVGLTGSNAGADVLKNLEGCTRHYSGVVTAGLGAGFSGSVQIDCTPAAAPPPAV